MDDERVEVVVPESCWGLTSTCSGALAARGVGAVVLSFER
jgi:hypothetical protein